MTEKRDVVIVGAGMAGLITARELTHQGIDCVLLEARDRIGGRTWTDDRLGRSLEIGGTWLHWTQPHSWSEVTRYGLNVTRGPRSEETYWLAGDEVRRGTLDDFMALIDPGMTRLLTDTMALIPRPDAPLSGQAQSGDAQAQPGEALAAADAVTVQEMLDRLDLPVAERNANEAAWVGHLNAPLDQCSFTSALRWTSAAAGSWHLMHEASAIYRLVDGTRALVDAIAQDSKAEIRLAAPVHSITHGAESAVVSYGDGQQIEASRVVITVPQNTLHQLPFSPALPEGKIRPSEERTASQGVKVWIRVRGPIRPFFAYSSQHHPLAVVRTEYIGDTDAVLVAFGPDATRIDGNDVEAVAGALKAWRDDLEVLEVTSHDWMSDPYSQETWFIQRPHQLTRYHHDQRRSVGVLHFASSDYATVWAGFIDGAIESALRTAREIGSTFPA